MKSHLAQETTTLATCWQITRVIDQKVFRFTDHDKDILFNGDVYEASTAYTRTGITNETGFTVDDLQVTGILNSDFITEQDLRSGLFDYAEVKIFMVDFTAPDANGDIKLRKGWLGEIIVSREKTFTSELRGLTQALSFNVSEVYSPSCRADLGDTRCTFVTDISNIRTNSTPYNIDDIVIIPTINDGSTRILPFINIDFEDDSGINPIGWVVEDGSFSITPSNLDLIPNSGTNFLTGGNSPFNRCSQEINILDGGLFPDALINGVYTLSFSIYRATSDGGDTSRVLVEYLDVNRNIISSPLDTGLVALLPEDVWVQSQFTNNMIPPTCVYIKVTLEAGVVAGSFANVGFDTMTISINDSTSTPLMYENVWYRATTAGTSDVTQPVIDTTIGATTLDGTVIWTAERGFTQSAQVVTVTDNRQFTVDLLDKEDDFYNGGVIFWYTGLNAGRRMEIKDWTLIGSSIELYLPVSESVNISDVFSVNAGCDKKIETCRDKFNNVINFRGEPHLPGEDLFLERPSAT